MKYDILLFLLLTAGCAKEEIKPEPPTKIVTVPDVRILYAIKPIEINKTLFEPCPIRQLQTYTIADLNKTIKSLQASIAKCNDDKQKIKAKINESN